MPRLRLRRLLLTLVAVAGCTMLGLNLTSREAAILIKSEHDFAQGLLETGVRRKPKFETVTLIQLSQRVSSLLSLPTLSPPSPTHPVPPPQASPPGRSASPFGSSSSSSSGKLWFMKDGAVKPQAYRPGTKPLLWPEQDDGDRIVQQLMYIPANYTPRWNASSSSYQRPKLKKILLYFGKGGWNDLPLGRTVFQRDKCPVDTCELSTALRDAESADAIFFKDRFLWPFYKRSPDQVWILFLLECPLHTQGFKNLRHVFNWTATYRHDSDLVAPYEKFVLYEPEARTRMQEKNYAANKTKKVAWFVSNCNARNKRLEFARELSKHIEVDIYGSCGNKRCPRALTHKCFRMLDREYKFYLAFENSNCKDYITEKFFVNGLSRDIVPVVMGARPEDYARAAPYHSYIHVDDFASAKELAAYLHLLDKNDTLYNEYFHWKGTGEFINTYFWCRMCALLHAPLYHKSYPDMHQWWAGHGTCNAGHWRPNAFKSESTDVKADDDNG